MSVIFIEGGLYVWNLLAFWCMNFVRIFHGVYMSA